MPRNKTPAILSGALFASVDLSDQAARYVPYAEIGSADAVRVESSPSAAAKSLAAFGLLSDAKPPGRDEADQLRLSPRLRLFEYVLQVSARRGQADL
jgi:hypothetical protein